MPAHEPLIKDYDDPKRPLAAEGYRIPDHVRLEGGRLFWTPVWTDEGRRRVTPTVETFIQFLELGESEDDRDVLRFAKRWGVLNLCKKHLEPLHQGCLPLVRPEVSEGEPVSEWRRLSRAASAILRIAEQLYEREPGKPEDWSLLKQDRTFGVIFESARRPRGKVEEGKALIVRIINFWLTTADIRPTMRWGSQELGIVLASRAPFVGLFAALGVQLLENGGRFAIVACTGCRKFFNAIPDPTDKNARQRRPKTGQGRYCRECIDAGVPVMLAKRRQSLGISKTRKAKQK